MPDQYGRITVDDWNQATNSIVNMASLSSNLRKNQEARETNQNLSTLLADPKAPLSGSPISQIQAKQLYLQDAQNSDTFKYREILDNIIKWKQAHPEDEIPENMYVGPIGQQVIVDLNKMELENKDVQRKIHEGIKAEADTIYQQYVLPIRTQINEDLAAGKVKDAAIGIQHLWKKAAKRAPYAIGEFDPATQSFKKLYNDSQSDGFKEVGTVSLEDAMGMINQVTQENLYPQIAQHLAAVRLTNEENRMPDKMQYANGPNGREYMVIAQKRLNDPLKLDLEVRDMETNRKIMFDSYASLQDAGFQLENIPRIKAERELQKQQLDISNALRNYQSGLADEQRKVVKHGFDVNEEQRKQARYDFDVNEEQRKTAKYAADKIKDVIQLAVHYFGDPSADVQQTMVAILASKPGAAPKDTSYTRALEFYEDNKNQASQLQGVDAKKFQVAEQFVNATQEYFNSNNTGIKTQTNQPAASQQASQQQTGQLYTGAKQPAKYPTAKREKGTGRWLIQAPDGRWGYITNSEAN